MGCCLFWVSAPCRGWICGSFGRTYCLYLQMLDSQNMHPLNGAETQKEASICICDLCGENTVLNIFTLWPEMNVLVLPWSVDGSLSPTVIFLVYCCVLCIHLTVSYKCLQLILTEWFINIVLSYSQIHSLWNQSMMHFIFHFIALAMSENLSKTRHVKTSLQFPRKVKWKYFFQIIYCRQVW